MSLEGSQNLNYGFVEDNNKEVLTERTKVSPFEIDTVDSGNHVTGNGKEVKLSSSANRVRFFRRNPNLTEESSLLEKEDEITVNYFARPKEKDYAFLKFKKLHSSVTLSDSLHKAVYLSLIANFILFARRYLDCNVVNSMIASLAVVICCSLTSAALILIRDILPRKLPFIFLGFLTYVIGLGALVSITNGSLTKTRWQWSVVFALFFVCFGEAALRTVLLELGLLPSLQEVSKGKQFAWRMHRICNVLIITIAGLITAIQQNVNFDVALYICICLMVIGFMVFLIPFKQYNANQRSAPSGTLHLVWNILREARDIKRITHENKKGSPIVDESCQKGGIAPCHWIDFAMTSNGGTYEEPEVKAVKCLYDITIIFFCLIPYWIAHAQCYTTYFYQGMHLDTRIGEVHFPIAWLSLFSMTTVMVLAPLFDFVLYPKLESFGIDFPVTWRMLSGLVCCCISFVIAGSVEGTGISYARSNRLIHYKIGDTDIVAVSLSIFVQVPQYFFLALSEVLTPMTALSIAHRLCHGGFQKLAYGMYFVTIPLGHTLALIFISFGWFPEDGYFVHSSVQIYFFLLAGLMLANACILAIVIYKMIDIPSHLREE